MPRQLEPEQGPDDPVDGVDDGVGGVGPGVGSEDVLGVAPVAGDRIPGPGVPGVPGVERHPKCLLLGTATLEGFWAAEWVKFEFCEPLLVHGSQNCDIFMAIIHGSMAYSKASRANHEAQTQYFHVLTCPSSVLM